LNALNLALDNVKQTSEIKMSKSESDNDTQKATLTVERGLIILRAFRAQPVTLSNAELVRRTGLPKATVSRLTSTLTQTGFLKQVAGRRQFELGTSALGIGHAFIQASRIVQIAQPFMQTLANQLDVSTALAVGSQLEMLYVAHCAGEKIATLRLGIGSLVPIGTTAIGRSWLWGLKPAAQTSYIANLKQAAGPNAKALETQIQNSFAELEETGVCFLVGGYKRNGYGIALPLRVGREKTVMALSCEAIDVDPNLSALRRKIVPALKAAVPKLEALLADIDELP
jgi:DNA-binding IclR family transcriptional regulator